MCIRDRLRLVADLTANSVSASQIDSITDYLDNWESVSFDDMRKVVDILISQIDATSESVTTVSYTHLDVYKRQGHGSSVGERIRL